MKYPLYKGTIKETDEAQTEVSYISLVEEPAIEFDFLAFGETPLSFAVMNEEERILTGLAMVADKPLYREIDEEKFYVYYDAPEIQKIVQKFFRKGYNFKFKTDHKDETGEEVYIFESWIVDREKGKPPMEQFKDVPNGSWFISCKVISDKIWNDVKTGNFKGFSVEGLFRLEKTEDKIEMDEAKFWEELEKLLQSSNI